MSSEAAYKGARFFKCALQVNSHGYIKQFRGEQGPAENEYNQQLLDQCRQNHIQVVGLADHGSIDTSTSLRSYLAGEGITVFPGFEIASSEKIHMVCLYPENATNAELNQFLGRLMGSNSSQLGTDSTHPSSLSCEEMAKRVLHEQNGFWYAAHTTGRNGC